LSNFAFEIKSRSNGDKKFASLSQPVTMAENDRVGVTGAKPQRIFARFDEATVAALLRVDPTASKSVFGKSVEQVRIHFHWWAVRRV